MDPTHPGVMPAPKHLRLDCRCCGRFLMEVKNSLRPIDYPKVTCPDCGEEYSVQDGKARVTAQGTPPRVDRRKRA